MEVFHPSRPMSAFAVRGTKPARTRAWEEFPRFRWWVRLRWEETGGNANGKVTRSDHEIVTYLGEKLGQIYGDFMFPMLAS